ncbi:hypothetical protein PG990_009210 [Apiospora arundinis]
MFDDGTIHPLLAHNSVADLRHLDGMMIAHGAAGTLDTVGGGSQGPSHSLDCDFALDESQWTMLSPESILRTTTTDSSYANSSMPLEEFPEPVSGYGILAEVNESSMPRQSDAPEQRKGGSSQRRHYAVEKRYRSTLNGKYAALARALSSEATQRICRTDSADWAVKSHPSAVAGTPQRKTATLSSTIETIEVLHRCCRREAAKLEQLQRSVQEMRHRMQQVLDSNPPTRPESPSQQQQQQQQEHEPHQLPSPHTGYIHKSSRNRILYSHKDSITEYRDLISLQWKTVLQCWILGSSKFVNVIEYMH